MIILYLAILAAHLGVMSVAMKRGADGRWGVPRVVIVIFASAAVAFASVQMIAP